MDIANILWFIVGVVIGATLQKWGIVDIIQDRIKKNQEKGGNENAKRNI